MDTTAYFWMVISVLGSCRLDHRLGLDCLDLSRVPRLQETSHSPQGEMGCLHQPSSLTFGTSSKKKMSPLNVDLLSSLGKRKAFQTSSVLAAVIKSRLGDFRMTGKDFISGS